MFFHSKYEIFHFCDGVAPKHIKKSIIQQNEPCGNKCFLWQYLSVAKLHIDSEVNNRLNSSENLAFGSFSIFRNIFNVKYKYASRTMAVKLTILDSNYPCSFKRNKPPSIPPRSSFRCLGTQSSHNTTPCRSCRLRKQLII